MIQHVHASGPVLVLGGPYSNLQALRAVLEEARRRGIAPSHVICTGDVVAYGADAAACLRLARESGIHVVQGNCEEALAAGREDCGCGYRPGSACDRLSAAWFAHAGRTISEEARAWMVGLPRRIDLHVAGLRLAVLHGAPSGINRFVFASTPARVKGHELDLAGVEGPVDGIIVGHSGLPFSQVVAGRLWHDAGAVGMPANDGTARTWFSVLTPGPEPRSLSIEHLALDYDHGAAAGAMRAAGLPGEYADALLSGLWPSCEVLPAPEIRAAGQPLRPGIVVWGRDWTQGGAAWPRPADLPPLDPAKFQDPRVTAGGERRARVPLEALRTLWVNTGTLCNLACAGCYIESTPRNDRLAYIGADELGAYLDEIERDGLPTETIGFTGGEPFMNPDMLAMLADVLGRGLRALILTNAMRPMQRHKAALLALQARFPDRLTLRVSVDHYTRGLHELERGPRSWAPTLDGLRWLGANGFRLAVAGRLYSGEAEGVVRAGYARLFAELGVPVDAADPVALVLFPEMDERLDVPEITESCWGILGKQPADVMCASSRMVVKRKGAERPAVLACTLLAYEPGFELGTTLAEASGEVALNHPHCARFCVLGGAACSKG